MKNIQSAHRDTLFEIIKRLNERLRVMKLRLVPALQLANAHLLLTIRDTQIERFFTSEHIRCRCA